MSELSSGPGAGRPPFLRTNVLAGVLLVVLGVGAFVAAAELAGSRGPMLGPGSLPRGVAVIVAALGVVIAVVGLRRPDADRPRWSLRAPVLLLGAVVLFALLVRPFGLAVATPVAIVVGGLASPETRPAEIVVFAVLLTAFCVGLFRYALGLPIPVAPWAGL